MRTATLLAACCVGIALAHDVPINPLIGEGGFPDCVNSLSPEILATQTLEENIKTMTCSQKPKDHADQITIGCVGDSITAGVHSEPPPPPPCASTEYCPPVNPSNCLTPTGVSCAKDGAKACSSGQVCDVFTAECVKSGYSCKATNQCFASEFCSPVTKTCLTPVAPGTMCDPANKAACATSQVCDSFIKQCVTARAGSTCNPALSASPSPPQQMDYPSQLQSMLNTKYPSKYSVTNLGACGATMMKGADSPYWKRPQFTALTKGKWDIIIIMLGTNDAKVYNWVHNNTFPADYKSMIDLVRTLGTTAAGPKIYLAMPPPLMQPGAYGMNQTVINTGFQTMVPTINKDNKLPAPPINVFAALGGVPTWPTTFPPHGCTLDNLNVAKCGYFCEASQHWQCDQCHPDDLGYTQLATTMMAGIGL